MFDTNGIYSAVESIFNSLADCHSVITGFPESNILHRAAHDFEPGKCLRASIR